LLQSEEEVADWLDIDLSRLRWFTHDQPVERVWHYVRRTIPKRSGGERVILAPKCELKALQRNTFARVRGVFQKMGYPFVVSATLALLCTERDREEFGQGRDRYYVSLGPRHTVQGAPTSPAIANRVAYRLDRRLEGLAGKHEFAYTRYADDLTFSGDDYDSALRILDAAQRIIGEEDFQVNPEKTRLQRRKGRQVVTGLVVNDQVSTPRQLRKLLRAILHNAELHGLESQNRAQHPDFYSYLAGLIGHVHAANPQQAEQLLQTLRRG
jgi:RNA-directed DNA polymerase